MMHKHSVSPALQFSSAPTHADPSHTHTANCSSPRRSCMLFLSPGPRQGPLLPQSDAGGPSRAAHCPQLFKDPCIISWRRAISTVNSHFSLKLMTQHCVFTPKKESPYSISLAVSPTVPSWAHMNLSRTRQRPVIFSLPRLLWSLRRGNSEGGQISPPQAPTH